jgi:hypothetical protein
MMIEGIQEGLKLANKNLQLVLIRIIVSVINLVSLIIFIAIPLVVAIAYLGLDLVQAKDMLPFIVRNPFEFISRYLGLIIFSGISLTFYLMFASVLYIYTLGGALGVLKSSSVNILYKFRFKSFFKEANANFSRLLWIVSLVLLGVIVLLAACIVAGGLTAAVVQGISGSGSTLEVFFSSFAMLTIIVFVMLAVLAGIVFTVYSIVILVIEGKGVMESIGSTFNFLKQYPQALLFYVFLLFGIIAANAIYYGIQLSLISIPAVTPLMYLLNAFFQGYLSIVVWSSLIAYYVKRSDYPVYSSNYEI